MADDFASLVSAGTPRTDAVSGLAQGVASGANWAHSMASLDLQKQSLQEQIAQHQEIKRQFNAKLGQQMVDDYNEFATLPSDSPLKKIKGKMWQENYTQAGILTPQSGAEFVAAANDEKMQADWNSLYENLTGIKSKNPEAFQKAMEGFRGLFGNKLTANTFEQLSSKAAMLGMMGQRLDLSKQRLASTETRSGQQQYLSAQKPIENALTAIARVKDLVAKGKEGDAFKLTQQLMSTISNEKTKVEIGAAQSAEGSRERGIYKSVEGDFSNLLQRLSGVTKESATPDFIHQIEGEVNEMGGSYQKQHDNMVSTLLGGALPNQKSAITGLANAYRKAKVRQSGSWAGEGFEGAQDLGIKGKTTAKEPEASVSPTDQKAQLAKQAYDKESNPDRKAAIKKAAIAKYGEDAAKKAGF